MKKIALLSLLFLVSSSALAGEVFIPAVYRGAGANGTSWRTEIVVSNISPMMTAPVRATITLHRDNGENVALSMPLTPREVVAVPDAVYDWFSVENGGGIVRVTWDDQPNVRIVARARVYNVGPAGQYGQAVPGVDPARMVTSHYLIGLSGVNGNRTNIGVSNPFPTEALIFISLYDTAGSERGGFATSIPPRSFRQFNDIFSHFQTGPLDAAMVHVSGVNLPVFAYASIVRNDTGDATFVVSP